jgi:hypothetical protein
MFIHLCACRLLIAAILRGGYKLPYVRGGLRDLSMRKSILYKILDNIHEV